MGHNLEKPSVVIYYLYNTWYYADKRQYCSGIWSSYPQDNICLCQDAIPNEEVAYVNILYTLTIHRQISYYNIYTVIQ